MGVLLAHWYPCVAPTSACNLLTGDGGAAAQTVFASGVQGAVVTELGGTGRARALWVLGRVDGAGVFLVPERDGDRVRLLQFRRTRCDGDAGH